MGYCYLGCVLHCARRGNFAAGLYTWVDSMTSASAKEERAGKCLLLSKYIPAMLHRNGNDLLSKRKQGPAKPHPLQHYGKAHLPAFRGVLFVPQVMSAEHFQAQLRRTGCPFAPFAS